MANTTPVNGFLDALKKWIERVESSKPDHALPHSETARIFGNLLSEDREFQAIFRANLDHCGNPKPENAMNCVYAFLNSIADATGAGFRADRHN